jgi:hypothetical protein
MTREDTAARRYARRVKRRSAGMKPEIRWRQDERNGLHGFDVRKEMD